MSNIKQRVAFAVAAGIATPQTISLAGKSVKKTTKKKSTTKKAVTTKKSSGYK